MNDREQRADQERENRDGLRASGYWPPPLGSRDSEDCRDQRSGVGDADPEYEIRYIEGPVDRAVDAGDSDPYIGLVKKSCAGGQHHRARYRNRKVPTLTGAKDRP